MSQPSVPADFELYVRNSNFSELTGPYFVKAEKGSNLSLGMIIESRHLNRVNVAHGGVLMTLADNALGDAVIHAFDEPVSVVTVSMSTDFITSATLGEWVVAETEVHRRGRRLMFVECMLRAGDRKIMRASAVMSLIKKPAQ